MDFTKLHPIHQEQMEESVACGLIPPEGIQKLYDFYLDLNETVPDIIGKQEEDMTKSQKTRFDAKVEEIAASQVVDENK